MAWNKTSNPICDPAFGARVADKTLSPSSLLLKVRVPRQIGHKYSIPILFNKHTFFFCSRVTTSEITASPDEDYGTTDSIVIFASGDAEKTVSISVIDDDEVEGEEAFEVKLALNDPALPGVTIGDRAMTTVVIEDIEGVSTALATLTTESPSTAGKREARCGTIVSILKSLVELMGFPGRRYFRACLHGGGDPRQVR